MFRSVTFAMALAAALVVVPQDASAQAPARDGFFIGLGLGGGSFSCSTCVDRQSGVSGQLKLGTAISQQMLIGLESSAWTKEEGGARLTHANVSAMVQFYPMVASGFFLRGGIGLSTLEAGASVGGTSLSVTETGLGLSAGLGYDVRVGSNFSVSPFGTFDWGNFDGGSANNFQLGLGVTWH